MTFLRRGLGAALGLLLSIACFGTDASAQATIQKVENKALTGTAYARQRSLTYAQCEERCLKDPQCVAIEHHRGGGVIRRSSNCALFSATRQETASNNSDIGYKRQTTARQTERRRTGATRSLDSNAPEATRAPVPNAVTAPTPQPTPRIATRSLTPPPPVAAPGPEAATAAAPAPQTAPPPRPASRGISPITRGADPAGGAAPPTVGAAAPSAAGYHVVPVFYGTNRNRKPGPGRIVYANDRTRKLELGQALVSVPLDHKVPNIERPRAWNIPFYGTVQLETEDPRKHFTIRDIKIHSKAELLQLVKKRLGASETFKGQSIIFIHGYNVGFDDSLYRTAQISYDLQFDGAAYTFSWPSGGGLASYVYDRDSAQGAEPYLYEFLQMVQNETGTSNINIIAHSMGNQMLLQVLRSLKLRSPGVSRINQIVLAAPDVDRDAFESMAREITGIAKGITLYAASNDRALNASRIVAGNKPRAGDVPPEGPVILPGIDTIDISGLSTSYLALHHSGYAENSELLTDISHLFRTGMRPPELRVAAFRRVTLPAGIYWRYGN